MEVLSGGFEAGKKLFPLHLGPGFGEPVGTAVGWELPFHQPSHIKMIVGKPPQPLDAEHLYPFGKDPLGLDLVAVQQALEELEELPGGYTPAAGLQGLGDALQAVPGLHQLGPAFQVRLRLDPKLWIQPSQKARQPTAVLSQGPGFQFRTELAQDGHNPLPALCLPQPAAPAGPPPPRPSPAQPSAPSRG